MKSPLSTLAGIALLLAVTGCADLHLPRIDPSGQHLFICDSPPVAAPCPPGAVPAPPLAAPVAVAPALVPAAAPRPPLAVPPPVSPYSDVAVMLSPFSTTAPVGSQVVMLGGVRGGDGYLRTNRRLEWWLVPGSVGRFTCIGEHDFADFLVGDFTRSRVVSSAFAIGSTTRVAQRAGGPGNNVYVARGQGWVTVSSPVEGVSHVTVVAPDVVLPDQRAKSAMIYWIDAQYGFPTPAIIPAGAKQSLTTTVWRQSNHCPRPGWIVHYEVASGPPAVFGPAGTPSIEAPTNEAGQASVEIFQKDPSPGTNQVRVQVIRPADSCGGRLMVRESSVLVTWTAPSLGIRQMGPPAAAIGETITYRIEVSNPGDLPAQDVTASEEVPAGLSFLQANPAPVVEGRRLRWRLGDLAPRQQQIIEANFRSTQPGLVAHCVEVTGAGGLRSSHCANTNVLAALPGPAPLPGPATIPPPGPATIPPPGPGPTPPATSILDLKVTAPEAQAVVGSNVTFDIILTNRGPAPATGINIRDTFGDGLEHQQKSPITGRLGDLGPGQGAKLSVTFRVTRPGQLCQHVEATADDGARAATDSCVTAVLAASGAGPATPPPGSTTVTPPPSVPLGVPPEIRVSGPTMSTVGKPVVFTAEITNLGQQPLADLVVSQQADAALVVTQATDGAKPKGNGLVWSFPSVPPGRSIRVQVQCDCKQPASKACCRFTATLAQGQAVHGQACLEIAAAAPPAGVTPPTSPATVAGRLDVWVDNVNLNVPAGENQRFMIQVANQGDYPENDIVVTARIPPGTGVEFGTTGPNANIRYQMDQGLIRFDPVAELPSKAKIDYRVVVRTSQPGPISLHVEATSRRQTQPAVGEKTVDVLPKE
jgi:uncharacterized repeat protein (TIGR01451 family)